MSIKKLQIYEARQAVELATQIYRETVAPYMRNSQLVDLFYQYVDTVVGEAEAGRLSLWGVIEGNYMIGMSAMDNAGHITMLYVHQSRWKRGIGRKLVNEMRCEAFRLQNVDKVTVNALPAWTAPFFMKCGFAPIPGMTNDVNTYVALQHTPIRNITYKRKSISSKAVLITTFGFLGLICIGTILYFLLTL